MSECWEGSHSSLVDSDLLHSVFFLKLVNIIICNDTSLKLKSNNEKKMKTKQSKQKTLENGKKSRIAIL